MSVFQPGNVAYGFSQALLGVPSQPIIAQRAPTQNDKANIGTIWIDQPINDPFIITSIVDNVATWVNINASGSIQEVVTDSGNVFPVAGVINLFGGANIETSGTGDTATVAVTPNIDLPATNAAGTQGIYQIGGANFGFMYPPNSVFLGTAGNTTLNAAIAVRNVGIGDLALQHVVTGSNNIAIGVSALEADTTGLNNLAIGYQSLTALTTGDTNIAIGNQSLESLVSGNDNLALGFGAGTSYTTTESSNILIGHPGIVTENHTIHIGNQGSGAGQQNACYIAGINGVSTGSPAVVTVDTVTGQMGTSAATFVETILGDTGSATGSTIAFNANSTAGSSVLFDASGSLVSLAIGDPILDNTIVGVNSGNGTISGTNNTSFGQGNLVVLTSGSNNTALGLGALGNATTSADNSAIGVSALAVLIGGAGQNIAVGSGALDSMTSGDNNIAIGFVAGSNYTTTETSNILIGNTGVIADANTIRIGTQGAGAGQQNLFYTAGIYGVTPGGGGIQSVTIDNNGQLGSTAGGGGGITTIDGDTGSATGATITFAGLTHGGSSVLFSASGSTVDLKIGDFGVLSNCIVGDQAGNGSISGGSNTGLGIETCANLTSGSSNTALGSRALSTLTDGSDNVAIGGQAMLNVTHASECVAVGYQSLVNVTTGVKNIAIGYQSNDSVSTGQENITIGADSGFITAASYNIAMGTDSGSNCVTGTESSNIYLANFGVNGESNKGRIGTTGSGNFEITDCYIAGTVHADTGLDITSGNLALPATNAGLTSGAVSVGGVTLMQFFTTGTPNLFLGQNSGNGTTTGTDNNALGTSTLLALTSGGGNVALGNQALPALTSGNNNQGIGLDAGLSLTTGSNNVAIGIQPFLFGNGSYNTVIGSSQAAVNYVGTESSNIIIGADGVVAESNVIRIGTQGAGNAQQNACWIAGIFGTTVGVSGTAVVVDNTGQLGTVVSSRRYKQAVADMGTASSSILELRPVTFNYKNDPTHETRYGLIAEEVEETFPGLVVRNREGDPDAVKYHDLPVLLLNELQKQHNIIAELSRRLERLEGRSKYEPKN